MFSSGNKSINLIKDFAGNFSAHSSSRGDT